MLFNRKRQQKLLQQDAQWSDSSSELQTNIPDINLSGKQLSKKRVILSIGKENEFHIRVFPDCRHKRFPQVCFSAPDISRHKEQCVYAEFHRFPPNFCFQFRKVAIPLYAPTIP